MPKDQEKTILIDKGYSYFVKVFSKNLIHLKLSMEFLIANVNWSNFLLSGFINWMMLKYKTSTLNKFMHLEGDSLMSTLIPPSDEKIKKFTIWCQVADGMKGLVTNEVNRPIGSSLIEGHGRFEYTKAYRGN